jgi:hypothetical protein
MEVIDYIPESDTMLSECSRILKNGCSLVFSFGNKASLKSKLRNLQGKSYMHSHGDIIKGLRKAGFKLVRKEGLQLVVVQPNLRELLSASFGQDGKTVEAEEDAEHKPMGDGARRNAEVKAAVLSWQKTFLGKYI